MTLLKGVVFLLLFIFVFSKEKCSQKCTTKHVTKFNTVCKKVFSQGHLAKKCSIKTIQEKCKFLCRPGVQKCWNKCEKDTCGKSTQILNVCNKKCLVDSACKHECVWERVKECWTSRIPGKYIDVCTPILEKVPVKECVLKCVPKPTCLEKCTKVHKIARHKRCWDKVVQKERNVKVCSVKSHKKKCREYCQKKRCFEKCKTLPMSCTPCTDTEPAKCTPGRRVCTWDCLEEEECEDECTIEEQTKCYMKRIPERKRICHDFWESSSVRKCLKVCTHPEKIHVEKKPKKSTAFELTQIKKKLMKMTRKIQKNLSKYPFAKRTVQLATRIQRRSREILNKLIKNPKKKDLKLAKKLTTLFK